MTFSILILINLLTVPADGRDMMKSMLERNRGRQWESSVVMTMKSPQKASPTIRRLKWWQRESETNVKILLKFLEPTAIKNTGLLIHSMREGEDQVWLFLPKAAKSEPRKIASGNKKQSFVGSEFDYADLEQRSVDDYSHTMKGSESCEPKRKCWKIESLKKASDAPYEKMISWIDQDSKVLMKADLYSSASAATPTKEFVVTELEQRDGIWTPLQAKMKTLAEGKETELKIEKIEYKKSLEESFFSFQNLTKDF